MLTVAFTFPAGRYHATPWGRHVNEADISWPPDLWRICRAFIAVWHRKLDQKQFPANQLSGLLSRLADEAPHYWLPEAIHFHTRHYMPIKEGKEEKRTLIFDAFARVDSKIPLIVHWPSLVLSKQETELLDSLLYNIGYLGRAESWVEAQRLEKWDGECNCIPENRKSGGFALEKDADLITMWMPKPLEDYKKTKNRLLGEVLELEKAVLEEKQKAALEQGKKKPTNPKNAKIPSHILHTLPENWLDALSLDTADLQKAAWSAPPAAKRTYYQRPQNALRFVAPQATTPARTESDVKITTARYALYAKPLPRLTDAVLVGERTRTAAMGLAKRLFDGEIPVAVSGHAETTVNNHEHAFFLPEDSNGDGRIDHILVHAPMGFNQMSKMVMAALNRIRTKEGIDWQLILEAMGDSTHFTGKSGNLLCTGRTWQSVTPYLHPWHRKKKFGIQEQIEKECRLRKIPVPTEVRTIKPAKPRPLDFRRFRSKKNITQPDRHGCFLRLLFSEPIQGPLALGFACHFGLGLFAPSGSEFKPYDQDN